MGMWLRRGVCDFVGGLSEGFRGVEMFVDAYCRMLLFIAFGEWR